MRKLEGRILSAMFLAIGVLGLFHHVQITGRLYDLRDILNHEFFEAIFITAGIVLLVSSFFFRSQTLSD